MTFELPSEFPLGVKLTIPLKNFTLHHYIRRVSGEKLLNVGDNIERK